MLQSYLTTRRVSRKSSLSGRSPRSPSSSSGPVSTSSRWATGASRESCRSTSRTGSAPAGASGRWHRDALARRSSRKVWGQLKDHLNDDPERELHDGNQIDWLLDPAIEFPNPSGATNAEPLLVNTAGSWDDRPDAITRIPTLYLASDYVRTFTDLATVEGANEAARRAVNGILESSGSRAARCDVWPLSEPSVFGPARALDRIRWRLFRRAAKPRLRVGERGRLEPTGPVNTALMRWRLC